MPHRSYDSHEWPGPPHSLGWDMVEGRLGSAGLKGWRGLPSPALSEVEAIKDFGRKMNKRP